MAEVTLKVDKRELYGKASAKRLRATGKIPGIIYGQSETTVPLAIDGKIFHDILHAHRGENVIFDVEIPGAAKPLKALLREIQHHPVSGEILHVDFQHISMTEKITVRVPVILVGSPIGAKEKGGILEHILHEVEIECLPTDIPEHIEADVSGLDVGDSIHISDLVAENVKIITEASRSIATVVPPTIIKAAVAEEVVAEEVPAEPELIEKERKGKAEEEEEGGREEAKK